MLTAYSPYLWLIFIVYAIAGWYLVRNFPIKECIGKTAETILLWPMAYQGKLKDIWKHSGTINEPILKYYLMEEWDKLILRVPVWSKKTNGEQFIFYRVIPAKVFAKSMEFPPFLGFASDMKLGKAEINRISSHFPYTKDEFGNAKWMLPLGPTSDKQAYVGDIIVLDVKHKELYVHDVINIKDLKNYTPW